MAESEQDGAPQGASQGAQRAADALGPAPERPMGSTPIERGLTDAFAVTSATARLPERSRPGTRMRSVRNALLRLLRPVSDQQTEFNETVNAAVATLAHLVGGLELRLDHDRERVRLEERDVYNEALHARDVRLAALAGAVDELRERWRKANGELLRQRFRVDALLREFRARSGETIGPEQLDEIDRDADRREAEFYVRFEERFRGSRETIMERQKTYLPDVQAAVGEHGVVVDLGPGRGEWLELLQRHGISCYGVDTNPAFAEEAEALGLDIRVGDAVEHLSSLPEHSVAAITAFHIAEHLAFGDLLRLVDASLFALRPGGALVIETPNPENIVVGADTFHMDPTHRRPLPPPLLDFVLANAGFVDVEVRYLHPSGDRPASVDFVPDELRTVLEPVHHLLFGPQDYAIIAKAP